MKLSNVRRILKEDIEKAGGAPPWIDQLLGPLNDFIDNVTNAFRNGVTLSDNLGGKIITVNLSHGVAQDVSPAGLKVKPIGLMPLNTGEELLDSYGFTLLSNGQVRVTYNFVDTAAVNVPCQFYLITG